MFKVLKQLIQAVETCVAPNSQEMGVMLSVHRIWCVHNLPARWGARQSLSFLNYVWFVHLSTAPLVMLWVPKTTSLCAVTSI